MNEKDQYVSYVLGKVETYIEGYAYSSSIPFPELAGIVAEFLRSKAGGSILGSSNNLPTLSVNSKRIGRSRKEGRSTVAEVAVLSNTHSRMWSQEAKEKLSRSMKLVWKNKQKLKKPHWTQTLKGRAFMAKRAKKMWKEGSTFRLKSKKEQ